MPFFCVYKASGKWKIPRKPDTLKQSVGFTSGITWSMIYTFSESQIEKEGIPGSIP